MPRERSQEAAREPTGMDFEKLYLAQLPHIDRVAEFAGRRFGLRRQEIEDLKQEVKIKIWAHDYAVLRQHRGDSTMETYLNIVVHRAAKDYVIHLWGKWRPSQQARRLGEVAPVAPLLERLLVQERRTFREACQIIRSDRRFKITEEELEEIVRQLPPRLPRRSETSLDAVTRTGKSLGDAWRKLAGTLGRLVAARGDEADARLWSAERRKLRERIMQALAAALERLPSDDALLAQFRRDNFRVADIARLLEVEQKPLYRRLERILKALRQDLEQAGISAADIDDILRNDDDDEP
jgi:RNA polymerase sigma factor (sigma-70 family)